MYVLSTRVIGLPFNVAFNGASVFVVKLITKLLSISTISIDSMLITVTFLAVTSNVPPVLLAGL